jgi:hypothetical protein
VYDGYTLRSIQLFDIVLVSPPPGATPPFRRCASQRNVTNEGVKSNPKCYCFKSDGDIIRVVLEGYVKGWVVVRCKFSSSRCIPRDTSTNAL